MARHALRFQEWHLVIGLRLVWDVCAGSTLSCRWHAGSLQESHQGEVPADPRAFQPRDGNRYQIHASSITQLQADLWPDFELADYWIFDQEVLPRRNSKLELARDSQWWQWNHVENHQVKQEHLFTHRAPSQVPISLSQSLRIQRQRRPKQFTSAPAYKCKNKE